MITALLSSGQFLSFLTVLAAGFIYIVFGWLFSSIFGDHADSHDVDGDGHSGGHETVSIFSPKVMAIFMVGFGAGGSIATYYSLGVVAATLSGLGVGAGFGGLALLLIRALYSQQASSSIETSSAIGQSATVVTDIPINGVGEVSLSVGGQHMVYSARLTPEASQPITRGSRARVVGLHGTSLVVTA